MEKTKTLTSILDSFPPCTPEESKEILERLVSLSEDDKKVVKIEIVDIK